MTTCPRCGWHDAVKADEAARLLGVTKQTVLNWIVAGRFPGAVREPVPGGYRNLLPLAEVEVLREARVREAKKRDRGAA